MLVLPYQVGSIYGGSASKSTKVVAATAGSSSGNQLPKQLLIDGGYDFIEGSGFVIEGLADKGLDAKSYIQVS